MKIYAKREHEFSYGHRVANHECKCKYIHGHNGKVIFHCEAPNLDTLGRVIDFGVIKTLLCEWVEDNYDHRLLLWSQDELLRIEDAYPPKGLLSPLDLPLKKAVELFNNSVVRVPFNPTAENIAAHLLNVVGPRQLANTNVTLVKVELYETSKCSATAELERGIGNE